ncbi:hypothetical protein AUK22_06590 [bacterium CG2_30_54_10]|nr:MAG: hypothetical protein AUK22_06590 [bacterium CG2_30_54_10]
MPSSARQVAISEILDRVLNKGVVLCGEIVISVADVPLLYLGVNVVLSSVETLLKGINQQ